MVMVVLKIYQYSEIKKDYRVGLPEYFCTVLKA